MMQPSRDFAHANGLVLSQGNEPVREWLRSLAATDRKLVGEEIRTVQLGWPIGMPVVRKLDAILLHGFIKKSQKIPANELHAAQMRLKQLRDARRR